MKTRKLTWEDLECKQSMVFNGLNQPKRVWKDSEGRTRVHVSLKGVAFVNKTLWLKEPDFNSLSLRASLLLQIHLQLRKIVHKIKGYELTE